MNKLTKKEWELARETKFTKNKKALARKLGTKDKPSYMKALTLLANAWLQHGDDDRS